MISLLKSHWLMPVKVLVNPVKTLKQDMNWKNAAFSSLIVSLLVVLASCPIYYMINKESFGELGLNMWSMIMGAGALFGLILPCIAFCLSLIVYTMGFSMGNNHKDGDYWRYLCRLLTVFSGYFAGISVVNILFSSVPQVGLIAGLMMSAYLLFATICAYSTLSSVGVVRGVATHALIVFWSFVAHAIFT